VEMTVCGKPGKRWCYFPPFPQTLEIDETDSHIPTATTMTRMNQISSKPGPLRDTHSEGKVKPLRPIISSRRIRQQQDLDELMKMAERGLQNAGYQPPEARELRRMMCLFARSARRFREGGYFVRTMLEKKTDFTNTWYLGQFVLDRLTLEEMKKS
jgi:hypothetical protein